jgi:peroxiredoxin
MGLKRAWVVAGVVGIGLTSGYLARQAFVPPPKPSLFERTERLLHQPAPDFTLTLPATKQPFSLSSLRGRVVVVNFWESSCPYCRHDLAQLGRVRRQFQARGLEVVGVLLDESDARVVRALVTGLGIPYPIAIGTEAVAKRYGGIPVAPMTFLVDRHGTIARIITGSLPEAGLASAIRPLL